ncbi:hypothetical protein BHE74_00021302 [Ensete ventricosum]|nr:hypothetical protein GW17_00008176 [Ensete ventricosum]RWW70989.1 hypothetical protein BHE74_00021302 [Ensete ventricosum]
MASTRPSSHRYASLDSRSSSDPPSPSSDRRNPTKNLSSLRRLVAKSSGRQAASEPVAAAPVVNNSSRALVKPPDAKTGHNFGSMVRKLMEKRPNPKPVLAGRAALVVPPDPIADDLKKGAKGSHFSALSRKLFQKCGTAERTTVKALMETKTNARTLAMVLRSERELLTQNKEYEAEISELRLLIEEKNQKIEKLKDLCLKQREEIKALKDAILFPDVMNSQLQELLEKQGFELKQANQVIPTLQKQVTSLTGQLQCLAEDLAEVQIVLRLLLMPLCASSLAVVSGRSRSSAKWMDPPCPTPKVGCWSGGVRVGRRCLSSGRAPVPARRSGRVSSRRDPSDGQVSAMVDFSIPLSHRGVGAFIVSAVGPSCLITLLPLRLTMSSYLSTMPLVFAVRRASAGKVCRPYLCQVGCTTTDAHHTCIRSAARVGSATSVGQLSEGTMTWRLGQHLPYHSS